MAAHQVNITDRAHRRIAASASKTKRAAADDRWNPANPLFGPDRPRLFGTPYVPPKPKPSRKHADDLNAEFLRQKRIEAKERALEAKERALEAKERAMQAREEAKEQKKQAREEKQQSKSEGSGNWPSEKTFQEGFKRGLTAAQIIAANPAESGGKYAPIAAKYLQAVIDRYGESNVHVRWSNGQASAEEGRDGAVRLTIPKPRTVHNLYTFLHECGHALLGNLAEDGSGSEYDAAQWAMKHMESEGVAVPAGLRRQIQQAIARDVKRDLLARRDVPQEIITFTQGKRNPAAAVTRGNPTFYWTDNLNKAGHPFKARSIGDAQAHVQRLSSRMGKPLDLFYDKSLRRKQGFWGGLFNPGRKNPASASAKVFEEFHGFKPSEVVTVTKRIHYHAQLAAAGVLTHLKLWGIDGTGHTIKGFKGAFLAFNEAKNQLFVEGGDQAVNLDDFGIDSPHELESLGELTDIGYQTNKTHLGDEGGEAVYVHKFRTTNDNGKHVTVRIARYPDLIYDVRNEQLLFSGGSYEILREGINT